MPKRSIVETFNVGKQACSDLPGKMVPGRRLDGLVLRAAEERFSQHVASAMSMAMQAGNQSVEVVPAMKTVTTEYWLR